MREQYQLCLQWPGRGLAKDAIRLASIEGEEWDALSQFVAANGSTFPKLGGLTSGSPPYCIPSEHVKEIAEECDEGIDYENTDAPGQSALLTLSMFLSQAIGQRQASVSIAVWPDERYDSQVYVEPGADLLADLVEINRIDQS